MKVTTVAVNYQIEGQSRIYAHQAQRIQGNPKSSGKCLFGAVPQILGWRQRASRTKARRDAHDHVQVQVMRTVCSFGAGQDGAHQLASNVSCRKRELAIEREHALDQASAARGPSKP